MDLTVWTDRLNAAEQRTRSGIRLVDACAELNIPWNVIRYLQAYDPERYERLLGRAGQTRTEPTEPTEPTVPQHPPAPAWRTKLGRDVPMLRLEHLAKLGDISAVDVRELLLWPPFPPPTPDGKDSQGRYWLPARGNEWLDWFARYRAYQHARRPPPRRIPGI